jgi:hypothetical protein
VRTIYPPDRRIGWHFHKVTAFALIIRGTSTETFTKRKCDRTERGLLLRPAGELHWDLIGSRGATCFLIEVGKSSLAELPGHGSILHTPSFHRPGPLKYLEERAYREWLLAAS